jgi:tetratricopeptide (TPR) repeat protein
LGLALAKLEMFSEAIDAYDRAIELDSDYLEPWNNRGISLVMGSENYVEALKSFDKAIEIDPNSMQAWANKANALNLADRGTEANAALEKAKRLGYKANSGQV